MQVTGRVDLGSRRVSGTIKIAWTVTAVVTPPPVPTYFSYLLGSPVNTAFGLVNNILLLICKTRQRVDDPPLLRYSLRAPPTVWSTHVSTSLSSKLSTNQLLSVIM